MSGFPESYISYFNGYNKNSGIDKFPYVFGSKIANNMPVYGIRKNIVKISEDKIIELIDNTTNK